MFCMNCGKEIKEGLKFCTNCGAPVESVIQEPVVEEVDDTEALIAQYESLLADVEAKKNEYEQLRRASEEADKIKLDIITVHEEIENKLKNARVVRAAANSYMQNTAPVQEARNTQNQPKFCPYCGSRITGNARFCGSCGKQIM